MTLTPYFYNNHSSPYTPVVLQHEFAANPGPSEIRIRLAATIYCDLEPLWAACSQIKLPEFRTLAKERRYRMLLDFLLLSRVLVKLCSLSRMILSTSRAQRNIAAQR